MMYTEGGGVQRDEFNFDWTMEDLVQEDKMLRLVTLYINGGGRRGGEFQSSQ